MFVIGEAGLLNALQDAGFVITADRPEYVVTGFDTHLTYEKLRIACLAVDHGARFIAANPDPYIPTEIGRQPGCGAINAFVTACTDVEPHVVGKPEKEILELALGSMRAPKEQSALIGDRLDTDILGANRAGIASILVLTGVTSALDATHSQIRPDYVFPNLRALRKALEHILS
jgi:4-nitrophenyl phosphatase